MLSQRSRDQLHTQQRAALSYEAEQNDLYPLDLNHWKGLVGEHATSIGFAGVFSPVILRSHELGCR